MRQVYLGYNRALDYYLGAMSDADLEVFDINEEQCRSRLFQAMKRDFNSFGHISQQRVLDAIEYILSSNQIDQLWEYVVPYEVPLDEVEDNDFYLRKLYATLAGHQPTLDGKNPEVELIRTRITRELNLRQ